MPGLMGTLIKIVAHVEGKRHERVFEFDPHSTCRSAVEKVCDALTISCEWTYALFSRKHRGWINDKTKMEDIVFKGHKTLELRQKTPAFIDAPLITPLEPSKSFLRDSTSLLKSSASSIDHYRLFNFIFRSGEGGDDQQFFLSKFRRNSICLSIVLFNHENKILLSPNGVLPTLQLTTMEETGDYYDFDSDSSDLAWMVKTSLDWAVDVTNFSAMAQGSSSRLAAAASVPPVKKRSSGLRSALNRSPSRSTSRNRHSSQTHGALEDGGGEPLRQSASGVRSFSDASSIQSSSNIKDLPQQPVEIFSAAALQTMHSPPRSSAWSPRAKGRNKKESTKASTPSIHKNGGDPVSPNQDTVFHQSPESTISPPSASPKFSRSIHDQHTSLTAALSAAPSSPAPTLSSSLFPDRAKDYLHENALRQGFVAAIQQAQHRLGLIEPLTMMYDKVFELPLIGIKTVVAIQYVPESLKDQVAAELVQLGNFRWRHAEGVSHSVYSGKEEFWADLANFHENHKAPALSSGLYVGLFHTESHLSGLQILVPRLRRNMIPLAKVRDDAELSDSEWEWIQSTAMEPDADMLARRCSVPKDDPMHHLKVEFARAAAKLAKQTKVGWKPSDLYTEDTLRLFTAQASTKILQQPSRSQSGSQQNILNGGGGGCEIDPLSNYNSVNGADEGAAGRQNRFIALNTDSLWRDPTFQMSETRLRMARSTNVRIILYVKPTRHATDMRATYSEQYLEYHPYQIFDATHHSVFNPVIYHTLRKVMRRLTDQASTIEARLATAVLANYQRQQDGPLAASMLHHNNLTHSVSTGALSEMTLADLAIKEDEVGVVELGTAGRRLSLISKALAAKRLSIFSLEGSTTSTAASSSVSSSHQFSGGGGSDHGDDEFEARSPRNLQDMALPPPSRFRRPTGTLLLEAVHPMQSAPNEQQQQQQTPPRLPTFPGSQPGLTGQYPYLSEQPLLSLKSSSPLLPPEHPFGEGYVLGGGGSSSRDGFGTKDNVTGPAGRRANALSKPGRRRSSLQGLTEKQGWRDQNILEFLRTIERECQTMEDNLQAADFLGLPEMFFWQHQQQFHGEFDKFMLQCSTSMGANTGDTGGSSGVHGAGAGNGNVGAPHARTRSGTTMERPHRRTSSFHSIMTNFSNNSLNSSSADVSATHTNRFSAFSSSAKSQHDASGRVSLDLSRPSSSSAIRPPLHPTLESLEKQKQQLIHYWRLVSWTRRMNTYALQQVPDLLLKQQLQQTQQQQLQGHQKQQDSSARHQQKQQQQTSSPQLLGLLSQSNHHHHRSPLIQSSSANSLINTATTLSNVSNGCHHYRHNSASQCSRKASNSSSGKTTPDGTSPHLPPYTISPPIPNPVPVSPDITPTTITATTITITTAPAPVNTLAAPTLALGTSLTSSTSLALSIQQQPMQQQLLPDIPLSCPPTPLCSPQQHQPQAVKVVVQPLKQHRLEQYQQPDVQPQQQQPQQLQQPQWQQQNEKKENNDQHQSSGLLRRKSKNRHSLNLQSSTAMAALSSSGSSVSPSSSNNSSAASSSSSLTLPPAHGGGGGFARALTPAPSGYATPSSTPSPNLSFKSARSVVTSSSSASTTSAT